jgi:cell division protein FtsI/penicillin-binding protein 2
VFVLTAITIWAASLGAAPLAQVIQNDYVTTALNQQRRRVTVNAPRGDIDRHGQVLATSAEARR